MKFVALAVSALALAACDVTTATSQEPSPSPCSPRPCLQNRAGEVVRILKVERNVVSPNPYEHPDTGNYFVRVTLLFQNPTEEDGLDVSDGDFHLQDPNGVKRNETTILGVECGWDSIKLAKNGHFGPKAVCFEAGGDPRKQLVFVWSQLFEEDHFVDLAP